MFDECVVMRYFIVMSWKFSGETEENHTKVSPYSRSWTRIQTGCFEKCDRGKLLLCSNIYVKWCI